MRIARDLASLTKALAALRTTQGGTTQGGTTQGGTTQGGVGFAPTMGALHEGHLALLEAARRDGLGLVASIFVNPLQFGPAEDFNRYPRDEQADIRALEAIGCNVLWIPAVETMYPPDSATTIEVAGPALGFEGALRPGHFRGVATVVARLFGQVRPDRAYFGEKDWQQLQVVTRMVQDLGLPLAIVPVPTVREADGLARSSRNRYLDASERRRAALFPEVLRETVWRLQSGEPPATVLAEATTRLTEAGFAPDYVALVDGPTLTPLETLAPGARLIAAAKLGSVRLLDNWPA